MNGVLMTNKWDQKVASITIVAITVPAATVTTTIIQMTNFWENYASKFVKWNAMMILMIMNILVVDLEHVTLNAKVDVTVECHP